MQVDHARDTLEKARIAAQQREVRARACRTTACASTCSRRSSRTRASCCSSPTSSARSRRCSVRSPVDGQVGQLLVAERANVAADAQLLTSSTSARSRSQMQVPESFARELAIGMPGEIAGNGQHLEGDGQLDLARGRAGPGRRRGCASPATRREQLRQNQRLSRARADGPARQRADGRSAAFRRRVRRRVRLLRPRRHGREGARSASARAAPRTSRCLGA